MYSICILYYICIPICIIAYIYIYDFSRNLDFLVWWFELVVVSRLSFWGGWGVCGVSGLWGKGFGIRSNFLRRGSNRVHS